MIRFVRASKYRHVYGNPSKKESCYDNLKISTNSIEGNLIKVNGKFMSVVWAASGGGAFAIIPLDRTGKLPNDIPLITGHTASVLDTDFSPFNDHLIASASEDTKIMLWTIPEGGLTSSLTQPSNVLIGHGRKVLSVLFHPTAENVLLSTSADLCVKLWDVEKGLDVVSLPEHMDTIQSTCFNYNGTLVATTCKDKHVRIFDIRSGKLVQEGESHSGVKSSYVTWLGDSNRILTTGFSRSSDRQIGIWDTSSLKSYLKMENLDTSSGSLVPHYDLDTKMLYLSGKGDANIRYFELVDEEPFMYLLSEYKSSEPQRGVAFLPKHCVKVQDNEIARAYKVTNTMVEPVSFIVPRKSDCFQADLYPCTPGPIPALSVDEFLNGKTMNPILINMENKFLNGSHPNPLEAHSNVEKRRKSLLFSQEKPLLSSLQQIADPAEVSRNNVTSEAATSTHIPEAGISLSELEGIKQTISSLQKENEHLKGQLTERDTILNRLLEKVNVIDLMKESEPRS